jgi:hypothetical protein
MTPQYTVEFRLNGNSADPSKITTMITGIALQTADKSLQSYQTIVIVATTDRPDVYKILSLLAASNPKSQEKTTTRKKATPNFADMNPSPALAAFAEENK